MSSATVSAKIPRDLKEKLERHGIKTSEVIREALREEVRATEERRLTRKLDEASTRVKGKISGKDIVQAVRAGREER